MDPLTPIVVGERAAFAELLVAALSPGIERQEAERLLREAQLERAHAFAALCADELGDVSRPVLSRQLAGLLFKNAFSRGAALVRSWEPEMPLVARDSVHQALFRALQAQERAVWSSAAAA